MLLYKIFPEKLGSLQPFILAVVREVTKDEAEMLFGEEGIYLISKKGLSEEFYSWCRRVGIKIDLLR